MPSSSRTPAIPLFEISWEVAHRVGGIHTVVSTKARTLAARYQGDARDDYVVLGPWLLEQHDPDAVLEPEPAYAFFEESCRQMGLPVRVGRWKVPGRPLTILVEFSSLYDQKDDVLADLWTHFQVDSLFGGWSYVEPVLFARAAGMVIERWWREVVQGRHRTAVVQGHEWMTGAALMYLSRRIPEIGTVFTTHATVLGRAAAEDGLVGADALGGTSPEERAADLGVRARHSLEVMSARTADVFTTVSDIAAKEAALFHGREPDLVLANGLDPDVLAERLDGVTAERAAEGLRDVATRFLGDDVSDAALVCMGARYEFRNKGIDVTLDAAAALNGESGRPIVLFLLIPAGNSGLRRRVRERLAADAPGTDGPIGVSMHHLHDPAEDPILVRCAELGLDNAKGSRVRVILWADYLHPADGVLDMRYEAALQGAAATCFPSYYEAWGYTPQESLALGIPTVTTDHAGFGRWAVAHEFGPEHGVHVITRSGRDDTDVAVELAAVLERLATPPADPQAQATACRSVAAATYWQELIGAYHDAHALAMEAAADRASALPERPPRRRVPVRSAGQNGHPHVFPLDVESRIPEALEGLEELAGNWWWSSDPEATLLFEELCPETWDRARHAPLRLLRDAPPERLDERATDAAYLARVDDAVRRFREYVATPLDERAVTRERPVAYICAEFGIHESFPIYSGGLGVLAGDHLRAASDLGVPLVAVGLLYRAGYMRQRLRGGAHQETEPDHVEPADLPLAPAVGAQGLPVEVSLQLPGSQVVLRAWRSDVGRVPLYLLDADVAANRPEDRALTRTLYDGDQDMRIRQEIILGIGGVRLLRALGIEPAVYHVNEGHGAFTALERVHWLLHERGLTFETAHETVRATTIFTTHTPVPAGHDEFPEDLVRRYFGRAGRWAGVPWERFMALGEAAQKPGYFNMTGLALRFAGRVNAVSRKHAEVSRELLHRFAPQLLPSEVPVHPVTNGVHLGLWTTHAARSALNAAGHGSLADAFRAAENVGDDALWEMRSTLRASLRQHLVAHLRKAFAEQGDSPALLAQIEEQLKPDALYIGFARRFATYKRAGLIFSEPERLLDLLDDADRPVRLVIAGKAHPRDTQAQELLARVGTLARDPRFVGRVVVLENYDMGVARWLVSGVDVWLNTPRRPLEASGTSGMKAAANGVLNLSIGDGWWLEGADGSNGWTIGTDVPVESSAVGATGDDLRDARDATSLLGLLRHEVIPEFFTRDVAGRPAAWVARVRRALATLPAVFDTCRMVTEYRDWAYEPLAAAYAELAADDYRPAHEAFRHLERVQRAVASARIASASIGDPGGVTVGDVLELEVEIELGALAPADVVVEAVIGRRTPGGGLHDTETAVLRHHDAVGAGRHRYAGSLTARTAGALGYGVRVRPARDGGPAFDDPVVWA